MFLFPYVSCLIPVANYIIKRNFILRCFLIDHALPEPLLTSQCTYKGIIKGGKYTRILHGIDHSCEKQAKAEKQAEAEKQAKIIIFTPLENKKSTACLL